MHALSVMQPWAALIVLGVKRIETRSWRTGFRGRLAVHASSQLPPGYHDLSRREPIRSAIRRSPWNRLPRGVLLGTVELRDCVRVEELDALSESERSFGDFVPGRWAWLLADPRPLPELVAVRGWPGVFEVEDLPTPLSPASGERGRG
jgi:hypothetical protein